MEFDQATRANQSALKMIKDKYKSVNYEMPNIIFWNVNSRQDNVPVRFYKNGLCLISGASPAAMQAVLSGDITPMNIVHRAVDKEKYEKFII